MFFFFFQILKTWNITEIFLLKKNLPFQGLPNQREIQVPILPVSGQAPKFSNAKTGEWIRQWFHESEDKNQLNIL